MSSVASKLVPILEGVKRVLVSHGEGPASQDMPAQNNKKSVSAAAAKLAELEKKTKASRTASTTIKATGAKRKK